MSILLLSYDHSQLSCTPADILSASLGPEASEYIVIFIISILL